MRRLILALLFLPFLCGQQSPKQSLTVATVNNITTSYTLECGGVAMCLDNRSTFLRRSNYHSISATGTGTWQVQIQVANGSPSGFATCGSSSTINQSSNPNIAVCNGYFDYILINITGTNASTVSVNYTGQNQLYITAGGGGGIGFPISISQGGTGATTAAGALANLLPGKTIFYSGSPAVQGNSTISTSGTSVTCDGSCNFQSLFTNGSTVTFYSAAQNGAGFITTGPLDTDIDGSTPRGSLVTGFGGASFSSLAAGDTITVPTPGGIFSLPGGGTWPINNILTSTKLRSVGMFDPQVGGGSSYPTVIVFNNVGYVTTNFRHGLSVGNAVTISGSGVANLDGAYTVVSVLGYSFPDQNSHQFTITTAGVANGTYANEGTTLSAGMPNPAISISVSSNVGTVTFIRPHGFNVGDPIRIAGYTGGGSNLNGSYTVQTVSQGDFPNVLTINTVGVANGTYSQVTGLIGTTWTYNYHPEQATVSSVSDNNHMTLSAPLSRNFPTGSTYWFTPDNYSAFQTAISTAKTNGQDLFIPAGNYYFQNTAANTGQPGGLILNTNFHGSIVFSPGAKFILNQVISSNGFAFELCDNSSYYNWHVDSLYEGPDSPIVTFFPFQLGVLYSNHVRIINSSSSQTHGAPVYVQYARDVVVNGGEFANSAGNFVSMDNVGGGMVANIIGRNSADEPIYIARNNATTPQLEGMLVNNIHLRNTYDGVSLANSGGVTVSNIYVESPVACGICYASNDYVIQQRVIFSNINIAHSGTLGPYSNRYGMGGAIQIISPNEVRLNDFTVRDSDIGMGVVVMPATIGNLSVLVSNGIVTNVPDAGYVFYGAGVTSEITANHLYSSDTQDVGLFVQGFTSVVASNIVAERAAKTLPATNNGYISNAAMLFWFNTNEALRNLTVLDDQATATGYKLGFDGNTGSHRVESITSVIADAGHQLTIQGLVSPNWWVLGYMGPSISSSATIAPTAQIFQITAANPITTITPPNQIHPGDYITMIKTDAGTLSVGGGGNIPATYSMTQNTKLTLYWNGTNWY